MAGADNESGTNGWTQLRFVQLLEAFRSTQGQVAQISLGMILGLVTIVGVAVGRQSWGLLLLGAAFEIVITLYVLWFNRMAGELLMTAAMLEKSATNSVAVSKTLGNFIGQGGKYTTAWLPPLMCVVIVIHLVLTFVLARLDDWSVDGSI